MISSIFLELEEISFIDVIRTEISFPHSVAATVMKQDYKSTPFTFGASGDTDRTITTVYTNLRLDF